MALASNSFLDRFDALIDSRHLLKHDFYIAWSRGQLSLDCLKEYAMEYYQHVKAFPGYIAGLLCRVEDFSARQVLLQNFTEEIAGSPNHPELWKNFAFALGLTQKDLNEHRPSKEMAALISSFRDICSSKSLAEGVAALYSYESQIPEICTSKIEGLKTHYNLTNPRDWEYFSVHMEADKEHAAQERGLLESCVNQENFEAAAAASETVLKLLQDFLSHLCRRYHLPKTNSEP